jgi:D-alanyl-D-alanine carboxypeptidase/D-alanyl-D-alanine-endopeptidase (penicillin-binding protein 4)
LKRHLVCVLIAATLPGVTALSAPGQSAAATTAPPPVPAEIEDVLRHRTLAGARVGLLAVTLPDHAVLVSRNAEDMFAPASVTKLFTTAAALWKLGSHYVWRTPIAYRGTKREGRIDGDLWILGRGAPDLVEERLWIAAQWLVEDGLTQIDGDIVVDDRYFAGERYGQGWPGGRQVTEAYHAPISALMANYAAQRGEEGWNAVDDPSIHFGTRFAALLVKAGARVRGTVRRPDAAELATVPGPDFRGTAIGRESVPAPLVSMYDIASEPLGRLVMDVNKFSNNVMAETVLRTLGAVEYGAPGTDTKGLSVVTEFLQEQLGVPINSYVQTDGSGLSPQNRFTPAQIVDLLAYAARDFHVGPELLSSLKISGLDGWSPAPFKYAPLKGELRVKSGHIRGVNTLSGFLHTEHDHLIAFAFMINDHHAQQWEIDQRMAEMAVALIREY